MRAIYSLKLSSTDEYLGIGNAALGLYRVGYTPLILWCESGLSSASIDGHAGTAYVALISEVSELAQSCEADSPVVNASSITITLGNHDKVIEYLRTQGIEILGYQARLSLNIFNSSGVLTSSTLELDGKIEALTYTDTTFTIVISANKFARNSQMLAVGEQLMIGESDSSAAGARLSVTRLPGFKAVFGGTGATCVLIGGRDDDTEGRTRIYQIWSNIGAPAAGMWMYVSRTGTASTGEYRKVLTVTSITSLNIDTDINGPDLPLISVYIVPYEDDGAFYEIEIDGNFTEGLIVDLNTYVQFVTFDHTYRVNKNTLSGTVERLYNKSDDSIIPFGTHGYTASVDTNGVLTIDPLYPKDDDTIVTYSRVNGSNLALIGYDGAPGRELSLVKWLYQAYDSTPENIFVNLGSARCDNINSGFEAGLFLGSGAMTTDGGNPYLSNPTYAFDVFPGDPSAEYDNEFHSSTDQHLVGLQFDLPAIADEFTFKAVYIALMIECSVDGAPTNPGVRVLTRGAGAGSGKYHFNLPVIQDGANPGIISSCPFWAIDPQLGTPDNFYELDWTYKSADDPAGLERCTGLENCMLQGIDSVEKYREIEKVGIFFPRDANSSATAFIDYIKIRVIKIIFKHENSLTEVYI